MTGSGRRSARSRITSFSADDYDDDSLRNTRPNLKRRRDRSKNQSSIRILNVDFKIMLGISVFSFLIILFLIHNLIKPVEQSQKRPRVVTPFPGPKLMDLPQVISILYDMDFKSSSLRIDTFDFEEA